MTFGTTPGSCAKDCLKCVEFAGAGYNLSVAERARGQVRSEVKKDKELGMGSNITRRDFLNGVAIGVGGTLVGGSIATETLLAAAALDEFAPEKAPDYYPPARMWMRRNHDGTSTFTHRFRHGKCPDPSHQP